MPTDASEASVVGGGTIAMPDSGHGGCGNGGVCGVVIMPGGGDAGWVGGGTVINPDSGSDASHGPCNGGPCGVIIRVEGGID
jgi:hypothetical protein